MIWLFVLKYYNKNCISLPYITGTYQINKMEPKCFTGNYIFSSDKKFRASTTLEPMRGFNSESKTIGWIENPVAVAGGCYQEMLKDICLTPFTDIECLEDTCQFTLYTISVQPTNLSFKGSLNGVDGYDTKTIKMVTIASKEKGNMKLYNYHTLTRYNDGHEEGISFQHYGIVVHDGKPEIKPKNTSKTGLWITSGDDNSVYFLGVSRADDVYSDVDYFKGERTAETKKLYLQDYQITLNPEGGLYTKDSPSYQFSTFKAQVNPMLIIFIVVIIIIILSIIGGVLCCVFLPCCPCNACCLKCMPCCPVKSENKEAEPEV